MAQGTIEELGYLIEFPAHPRVILAISLIVLVFDPQSRIRCIFGQDEELHTETSGGKPLTRIVLNDKHRVPRNKKRLPGATILLLP